MCICLFLMMLYCMETPFSFKPVHFAAFRLGCLKPLAVIAAKLETMKLLKVFFKHTYYFGCFCFCLVADVQHQGVMGVVMWLVITPHIEGVTSFFSWWILSFQFIVFSLPQQCCQSKTLNYVLTLWVIYVDLKSMLICVLYKRLLFLNRLLKFPNYSLSI